MTKVKTPKEIAAMRTSGRMLATVLEYLRPLVAAGMSTKDLSILAARELDRLGGKPAFLGYQGFPDVICVSVNDEIVHGIPSPTRILQDGDIVGLDFGVTYEGMVTDAAISVIVGGAATSKRHADLVRYTESSMMEGISVVRDHVRTGDIGAAVQAVLDKGRFGIIRDMVGHGVGHELHEDPNVPNYGKPHTGPWLQAGMTIAIEPMATLGGEKVYVAPDQWTIKSVDGSWSAHFEHTVLITPDGAEILTELR